MPASLSSAVQAFARSCRAAYSRVIAPETFGSNSLAFLESVTCEELMNGEKLRIHAKGAGQENAMHRLQRSGVR